MQTSLHETSKPIFWKKNKNKNVSKCRLLKILPSKLSVKRITDPISSTFSALVKDYLISSVVVENLWSEVEFSEQAT